MCGISCVINGTKEEVVKMGNAIKHRGLYHNMTEIDNIKVFFSWLPIVNKHIPSQPFSNGRYSVWLNGYISNYRELARRYKLDLWADSDTLFLLAFFTKFGFSGLEELNGFFSILCYDHKTKTPHFFSDRYGIKQLYEYTRENTTYVSSEVKGLLAVMDQPKLDETAVADWLHSFGVMTQHTIFKDVVKKQRLFWTPSKKFTGTYEEAKEILIRLLNRSFDRNTVTGPQIKTGVFLSGGIDSGIIAKNIPVDYSFSMDYIDQNLSEIENIKRNSTAIHLAMICNQNMWNTYKVKTIQALDDLKVGSSYTNFALTELASKYVTVLYSGSGSDELFYGYPHRYKKPIADVITRTDYPPASPYKYRHTHEEYDWAFLRGILIVEDRIGGWHTVETRYPYLDNDVVDFVLSLPISFRMNKRILKDISGLPKEVVEGKKKGFSNPITNKEWVEYALNETRSLYNAI